MSKRHRWVLCLAASLSIAAGAACSSGTAQREVAAEAVAAMGGAEKLASVKTVTMRGGTGTRTRVGQIRKAGEPDVSGQLSNVVETLDLANKRAAYDYDIQIDTFMQHRREVLTKHGDGDTAKPIGIESVGGVTLAVSVPGLFSWGTQNSPEFLLTRNAVSIALAAADSASASQVAQDKEFNGKMHKFGTGTTIAGEEVGLYFDPESKLIAGFEVLDTESVLGDVNAQYIFGDYKSVDGIMLPHRITIKKDGADYSDVQFAAIAINDPSADAEFAIPAAIAADAARAAEDDEFFPMMLVKAANGVHQAVAFRHHSMVVEFPTFIAVVEAPYLEVQSKALTKAIKAQFPDKPIRYVAVTHPHYDHIGGVRAMAATGATILVEKGHEAAIRAILDAPHTHPKDLLETRRATAGMIEAYEGNKVISEGSQSLELHAYTESTHVNPMVLAYVRPQGVLFQSDIFFPGTGGGGPEVKLLLDTVRKLNLRVTTNVGGHGGVGPFAELVKAAAAD